MISSSEQPTDISKIKMAFDKRDTIKVKPKDSDFGGFEWKLDDANFHNQISIGYRDAYSKKAIKVFSNGSLQVAGCSDLFDCMRIVNQLGVLFDEIYSEKSFTAGNFRVVMINTNFSLNYNVNLIKVVEHFSKTGIFKVSFEPDRYSAVLMKFKPAADMKEVTVSIFSTGKIIITGAETLKEIAFAYIIVNKNILGVPGLKVSKTQEKDLFETFMGYRFSDWISFLKNKEYKPWVFVRDNQPIKISGTCK
jgi:TATA-box binding protein (TBP) (component of TFIID and TFIIIB)